jgi:hypothetical protein
LQEDPGEMQASEYRPAAVSADAPADDQWRRQSDNHGHGRALVPPDLITGAPETAVTVLRERAEVAEQRANDAVTRAERTLGMLVVVQAKLAEAEDRAGDAERDAQAAWDHARAALDAAEALRRADAAQWGRGRWVRLRAVWRGAEAAGARRTKTWLAVLSVGILLAADVGAIGCSATLPLIGEKPARRGHSPGTIGSRTAGFGAHAANSTDGGGSTARGADGHAATRTDGRHSTVCAGDAISAHADASTDGRGPATCATADSTSSIDGRAIIPLTGTNADRSRHVRSKPAADPGSA